MTDDFFNIRHAEQAGDRAVAQNADLFTSDFQMTREDSMCRITVCVTTAVTVLLSPEEGTAFLLNGGSALTANAVYTEELQLDIGRSYNLQTNDASGTTFRLAVVSEVRK